uniref:Uncharacterized protein n=1 Tax=viral metagenome TaxID=1070528 RepID=A0A6M3KTR3_9ZZZZ
MATGKQEKVEAPTENPKQETLVEAQTATFTQQLEAARQEAAEQARQEEFAKYQGIQRAISKKDAEIKRLQAELTKTPTSQSSILSKMVDVMEEEGGTNPRISQLKAELAQEQQREKWNTYVGSARSGMEDEIREAGFDPDDPKFDRANAAFEAATVHGDFSRAKTILDKVLKTVGPKVEEKKVETSKQETAEQMKARIREEVKLELMKENDELKTDTGLSSGGGGSWEDFTQEFVQGKRSLDDWEKAAKKRGII